MDVNPTAVVFLQSLIFLLQPPNPAPADRLLPPPVAGCAVAQASQPPTTPTAGQAIPLLTHIPPLLWLSRLRVIPFLGLVVIHRAGVLGTAWSTWSTNESHRKMTVCERLIVETHHAHGRMHATASFLPSKIMFSPLTAGTHQLHLRTEGSA